MDEPDASKLVRDVADNIPGAFERFLNEFQPSLAYWFRAHYVRREDLEDLLQETFTKAFVAIRRGKYRHISVPALVGWLRTIASRLWVEHQRNQRPTFSQWSEDGERDLLAEVPDSEARCEENLASEQVFELIEQALDRVLVADGTSERARDVGLLKKVAFLGFYVDNLSQKEVARQVASYAIRLGLEDDITAAAVNNWLSRGDILKALVRHLACEHPDLLRGTAAAVVAQAQIAEADRELLRLHWVERKTLDVIAAQHNTTLQETRTAIRRAATRGADHLFLGIKKRLHENRRKHG